MKITLIGAGRLATHLGKALKEAGHDILQVYSRTMESASQLASALDASATDNLARVGNGADVYILSVKDSVLTSLIPTLCKGREDKVFLHTAGSMPMDVFADAATHYGVFYPMQTFSKEKAVCFRDIPCFVEWTDSLAHDAVQSLAESVSNCVYPLSSADRKYLHLSAVFACNFVNHCYAVSEDILASHHIPFSVMLPLIDETARKVHELSPRKAQTGPAVRFDENVINKQALLLQDEPLLQDIYTNMSKHIFEYAQNTENK